MRQSFKRLMLDHPASVDEGYFEHFLFALRFSGTLFFAGFAALLHAFVPGLCERTASKKIEDLHYRMHNR
ncbi:MAG: DUF6356 family protein [Pseudomonadota bacterium]